MEVVLVSHADIAGFNWGITIANYLDFPARRSLSNPYIATTDCLPASGIRKLQGPARICKCMGDSNLVTLISAHKYLFL